MQVLHKILLNLALLVTIFILFFAFYSSGKNSIENVMPVRVNDFDPDNKSLAALTPKSLFSVEELVINDMHFWCILTKVETRPILKKKFKIFLTSLIETSSQVLHLHIICDSGGKSFIQEHIFTNRNQTSFGLIQVRFYEVSRLADALQPLVTAMSPHFTSSPGSYYSDALFFLSLGLHKVAPAWMSHCIMVDIDTQFRADPALLWAHFERFSYNQLVGLSPELSPVYRHALHAYRASKGHKPRVGDPHAEGGYSGLNSGVVLLNLNRLRKSKLYSDLCEAKTVVALVRKYSFRGHLGDQDFYTLLGIERPELVHVLPCNWNRQLCTWWQDHGYGHIFYRYYTCKGPVHLYHGNCNTEIPAH